MKVTKYTCSRCHALKFYSAECQMEFWPGHKGDSNRIKDARQKAEEKVVEIKDASSKLYIKALLTGMITAITKNS